MLKCTAGIAKSLAQIVCLVGSVVLSQVLFAQSFSNPASISLPPSSGVGAPYPSNITVTGLTGTVIDVTITLSGISHTFPKDIGALLVTPGGQRIRLFTDVGGAFDIAGVTLTFSANAAGSLPGNAVLTSGSYLPTQGPVGGGGTAHPANFPAPAPAAPYDTELTTVNGAAPTQNGTWSLYVDDDTGQDSGVIAGGWSVTITTTQLPVSVPGPPTGVAATAGNAHATLTFAAPLSDGGLAITGYTATCNPGALVARGAASPLLVAGLTNGTEYSCSVTASNALGSGAASAIVGALPAATVPDAPAIGAATHGGNGLATIHFTPPVSNGGSPITGYNASCDPGNFNLAGAGSPLTITGLTIGVLYSCTVTAFNAIGSSAASLSVKVIPVAPIGPFAYITNGGDSSVSVIDTATNDTIATLAVGFTPTAVAVNPTGKRAYVVNTSDRNVSVINTLTNSIVATVAVGSNPQGVALNPAGTRAYVANKNNGSVSVIDTATNSVVGTVLVGLSPVGVAVNPAGTRAYVANSAASSKSVSVIDTATNIVVATVPVETGASYVAINPAGTRAYVTNFNSGSVSVIDTATNTVVTTIAAGTGPSGVAVNPAGTRTYVTNQGSGTVSVIDTATNSVIATIASGNGPTGIAVHPAGTRVYVANRISNTVSIIDVSTNAVIATVAVGKSPYAFGAFIGGPVLATTPGAPVIDSAKAENGEATISFTRPESDGGSPITTYIATCNPGSLSASGSASPLTVTGLLADSTTYTCIVSAINSAGSGAPSTGVSVTLTGSSVTFSSGPNGVLSSQGTMQVAPNGIVAFTGQANAGFQAVVGGSCPVSGAAPSFAAGPITSSCTVVVTFVPVVLTGFSAGASSSQARAGHTATLLNDGRVLISGGVVNFSTYLTSAERYYRAGNTWLPAASMQTARSGHTATLLDDGRVLVAGGTNGGSPAMLASVEIYNPATDSWASAAPLPAARSRHSALRLPDGNVLVSGGGVNSLSRYDPGLNSWTDLPTPAVTGIAALLNSGKVLIVDSASAKLFDPATNALTNAGAMPTTRTDFSVSLLPDGRVLTAGGRVALNSSAAVDLYDPGTNNWSAAAPMSVPRLGAVATLLNNGLVLVAAGSNNDGILGSAEAYDPGSNTWISAGSLAFARFDHSATRLADGAVLIYGGSAIISYFSSSELYLGVAASAPAAPTNLTAAAGNGHVTLSFNAPPSNGGAPIAGYTATCSSLGRPDAVSTATTSPIVVTGLVNFVGYICSVVATNQAGTGSASTPVSVITVSPPVINSATTAMGTVGQSFFYAIGSASVATSFAVIGVLPAGVSLDSMTGVISGTPTQSGVFNVSLSATNGAGTGTAMLAITVAGQFIALNGVVSRKIHGTAGPFDVVINPATPISGAIDVEPRAIGTGHMLVFQFDNGIFGVGNITARDAAMQNVGTIASTAIVNQTTIEIVLTDVPDSKRVTISITGVNGVTDVSASVGFLRGDVNNSRAISGSDLGAVKSRSGQTVNGGNFRGDVNTTGTVNASDIAAVKARMNSQLP